MRKLSSRQGSGSAGTSAHKRGVQKQQTISGSDTYPLYHKTKTEKHEQKAVRNPNEPDDVAGDTSEEDATAYMSESVGFDEEDLRVDDDQN